MNYEKFQQKNSEADLAALLENERIDMIVIDEIHYAKQRSEKKMSQRKRLVQALVSGAGENNSDLAVLGMSATPVINNLTEGRSMVELVTAVEHDDLETRVSVANCMRLHQRLVTLGTRWMPTYDPTLRRTEILVDASDFLDEIRALGDKPNMAKLERILTQAKLPTILKQVEPKTVIYTHYVEGIVEDLQEALEGAGHRVGVYTGKEKSGLNDFLSGKVDVLIGSSAIGTGVDGLQHVSSKLIVNCLPWTNAEFEQLKGRIYRQGQKAQEVEIVIPLTYAHVDGAEDGRWSWCESRMARIRWKKSVADAAVDGVVPEGHLKTPEQAYKAVMAWLKRIDEGVSETIERRPITIELSSRREDVQHRARKYGDFSKMNARWNISKSSTLHERLTKDPEEWENYHAHYREARKTWSVVPYEEIIDWCKPRKGYLIGDFGCGEAKLAEALRDSHKVHSFDHIALDGTDVIACDVAEGVPLDDASLDVAVFSLSLMGSNASDYIREAHRCLKLDGHLHIVEATSRIADPDAFSRALTDMGFDVASVEERAQFTFFRAQKTERDPTWNTLPVGGR